MILPGILARQRREPTGPAVAIVASRTSGVAPCGVYLEAELTGWTAELASIDLRIKWTFDDPGEWTALDADHPQGRDRNLAYGFMTGHVFAQPGSYTVTVEVTDGTAVATDTVTITVADPDTAFADATAVVSQAGDFAGAPAGAVQFTDVDAAVAAFRGRARILLRAGENFAVGGFTFRLEGDLLSEVMIGRFGTGANPKIDQLINAIERPDAPIDLSIDRVDGGGSYDAATGLGSYPEGVNVDTPGHVTVYGCRYSGVRTAFGFDNNAPVFVAADCTITNWQDFGVLAGAHDGVIVLRGCSIRQKTDASSGSEGKSTGTPEFANHGPCRFSETDRAVVSHCQLFTRTGWTGQNGMGGGTAHQQCVRWNASGIPGVKGVLERNLMEGGFEVISAADTTSSDNPAMPVELVIEKNYLVASANTAQFVNVAHLGVDFRNNVCVIPAVAQEYGSPLTRWVAQIFTRIEPGAETRPYRIRNNTFVDLRSAAQGGPASVTVFTGYQNVTVTNNLEHYPNRDVPVTPAAPLETAPALFAPLYDGTRLDGSPVDPAFATPLDTCASYKAAAGSPALGGATGPVPADDFAGRLRGASPSTGAWQDPGVAPTGTASAERWRVLFANSVADIDLGDLALLEAHGGADLTLPGEAASRALGPGTYAFGTPAELFDDLLSTGARVSPDGWVGWDFGAGNAVTVTAIRLAAWQYLPVGNFPDGGDVQYWDGAQWVTAWSFAGVPWSDDLETWEARDDGTIVAA